GKVVAVAPCRTVSVLLGPKPWPTTLIAMVAMPLCASVEATAKGPPCLLSVKPWPKMATGQPLLGRGPAGINRLKNTSSDPCEGTLWRVGTWGIKTLAFCQCCPANLPKASVATEPGNTCRAARLPFRLVGTSGPTARAWTFQVNPVTVLTGKTVVSPLLPSLKLTTGGAAALICSRRLR